MKAPISTSSSLFLPKITSQHLEQLIKSKKKPDILSTDLCRYSYKNYDKLPAQKNLRLSETVNLSNSSPTSHELISQHLDIKSPFYQRISLKHIGKWKCKCHQNKQNPTFIRLKPNHCSHHDQIIAHKKQLMKHYQDSIVSTIKKNHTKNHQLIEKNNTKYLHYSQENSAKIKNQKVKLTEKNKELNQNKLAKTISNAQRQKLLNMALLKEKLDQVYNLDNQNQQFQKLLLNRNRWQTKRNVWKQKILTNIKRKLKKNQQIQSKIQKVGPFQLNREMRPKQDQINSNDGSLGKMSQTRIKFADKQNQKMLQDIEACLGVLMKNISSVSDLVPKYQSQQIKTRISQIFKKNLNIEAPHYIKKLRKMMGEIIEDIIVEETEAKLRKMQRSIQNNVICKQQFVQNEGEEAYQQAGQKSQRSHMNTKSQLFSTKSLKSANCSVKNLDEKFQTKQKELLNEKNALQMKAEQSLLSASLLSNSYLPPINEESKINLEQRMSSQNKKFSILSGKSSSSNRKQSGLSKLNYMSNSLNSLKRSSVQSIKRKNTVGNDSSKEKIEVDNSSNKNEQCQELGNLAMKKNLTNPTYSFNSAASSISKQVICQKDELDMQSDDEQQMRTVMALKYFKSTRKMDQQIQHNRIDGMISLMKQKILNKKDGLSQFAIPQKYLKIKYDQFCTEKIFKYIVSMAEGFEGVKRFQFIYNQLRAKKKILNDEYVENLIKEFSPLIGNDKEVEEWTKFIFDSRTKIMLDSLNRMIDSQMHVMKQTTEEKEEKPIQNEPICEEAEGPKDCLIFNKIDQSQIAFERYLMKLLRQNQKEPEPKGMGGFFNIAFLMQQREEKQEPQQVSQKTINSDIETNSTKNIRYTIVDYSTKKKSVKKNKLETEDSLSADEKNMQYKKKVLGYMLRKNPLQFQKLNRNLNQVSKLFNSRLEGETDQSINKQRESVDLLV